MTYFGPVGVLGSTSSQKIFAYHEDRLTTYSGQSTSQPVILYRFETPRATSTASRRFWAAWYSYHDAIDLKSGVWCQDSIAEPVPYAASVVVLVAPVLKNERINSKVSKA